MLNRKQSNKTMDGKNRMTIVEDNHERFGWGNGEEYLQEAHGLSSVPESHSQWLQTHSKTSHSEERESLGEFHDVACTERILHHMERERERRKEGRKDEFTFIKWWNKEDLPVFVYWKRGGERNAARLSSLNRKIKETKDFFSFSILFHPSLSFSTNIFFIYPPLSSQYIYQYDACPQTSRKPFGQQTHWRMERVFWWVRNPNRSDIPYTLDAISFLSERKNKIRRRKRKGRTGLSRGDVIPMGSGVSFGCAMQGFFANLRFPTGSRGKEMSEWNYHLEALSSTKNQSQRKGKKRGENKKNQPITPSPPSPPSLSSSYHLHLRLLLLHQPTGHSPHH